MNDLLYFIEALNKAYGLFEVSKVEDIKYILMGLQHSHKESVEIATFLHGFSRFVEKKYEINYQSNWDRTLRFISLSDKHTLKLFKECFYEYCEEIKQPFPEPPSDTSTYYRKS